jgi:hypothetical protein
LAAEELERQRREESKMRQITVILVTAMFTAAVTVFSMMAISFSPVRPDADVRASASTVPIDVMRMMTDAKDLPNESYLAY